MLKIYYAYGNQNMGNQIVHIFHTITIISIIYEHLEISSRLQHFSCFVAWNFSKCWCDWLFMADLVQDPSPCIFMLG